MCWCRARRRPGRSFSSRADRSRTRGQSRTQRELNHGHRGDEAKPASDDATAHHARRVERIARTILPAVCRHIAPPDGPQSECERGDLGSEPVAGGCASRSPDADGDGETDARCGGLDCDDADALISSTRTHCASATSVTRWAGGMRVDAACDVAAPYCDARTKGCVADACGDRVVHANEQCDSDDTAMCVECHRACRTSSECEADQVCLPGFLPMGERSRSGCVPANATGAPFGATCTSNSECRSNYCEPADGNCTESSLGFLGECTGPNRWPEHTPYTRYPEALGGVITPDSVCAFECAHNSDCAVGGTCIPMVVNVPSDVRSLYFVAGCRADWSRGTTAQGEPCANDHECGSGVCVFERCSQLCRTAADCEAGAPNCVAADRTMPPGEAWSDLWGGYPRPADWGTPFPTVCLP